MERKTSIFEIKAEGTSGRFVGRASVYGVRDFYGDIVAQGAFAKSLAEHGNEIVVLNQHDTHQPIGRATLFDRADALWAEGQLVLDLPVGRDAYVQLKNGLVTGISIGYEVPPGGDSHKGGVRYLNEIVLHEISLVTFPANSQARITDVKRVAANTAGDAKALLASLSTLNTTIQSMNQQLRAERKADPVIEELERDFKRLDTARKMYGDADPFVQQLAKQLKERIALAQLTESIAKLRQSLRNVA